VSVSLEIVAKPGSKRPRIVRRGVDVMVAVRERALDGAANAAIVRLVAEWLGVPPSRIRLQHGAGGRRKLLKIDRFEPTALRELVDALPGDSL
jgi:uncharacterized protein